MTVVWRFHREANDLLTEVAVPEIILIRAENLGFSAPGSEVSQDRKVASMDAAEPENDGASRRICSASGDMRVLNDLGGFSFLRPESQATWSRALRNAVFCTPAVGVSPTRKTKSRSNCFVNKRIPGLSLDEGGVVVISG